MISSKNINNDTVVDIMDVRYLNKDNFLQSNARTRIVSGDILFTSVGTLGRSCIYDGSLGPIACQRSVSVIAPIISNAYLKL